MKPLFVPELDLNPEKSSICRYINKECRLQFTVKDNKRILALKGHSKDYETIEVKLVVENKMQFTFRPFYDNYTFNEFVVVDTHCHQLFEYFSGSIETEDGKKDFKDVMGFIEHAMNRW